MKQSSKTYVLKSSLRLLLTVFSVIILITAISVSGFYYILKAETYMRYIGIKNVISEKIAKTAWGMEIDAQNVFDEVSKSMDSPDAVIKVLESKAGLNPEVRGYFAAFKPDFFPERGTWFEPYVHQGDSAGKYELTLVGSARHNYTKSDWYVRAMKTHKGFWSDPYYYYDGTNLSGHYVTYVKPILDARGLLACVCGADITFEWLTDELKEIDKSIRENPQANQYRMFRDLDFYSVVLNHDGSCIANPEEKGLNIQDKQVLGDLVHHKSGVADMDINDVPCTVYYGPIDHVDWSVAVVVPQNDLWTAMLPMGLVLLSVAVAGMIFIGLVYRRIRYAETD